MNSKLTLGLTLGSAFVASIALTPMTEAAQNPFALQNLNGGYMTADATAMPNGKAAEAKCGADKKAAEAKCGADKKAAEAKCGADKSGKKPAEAKCGTTK